ncbi:MAG: TM2 domain-containing protein [Spartobacteria bacterium]|nr:TM2 domain-containing protein [Spartobacteria bacterium]
MTQPPHKGNRSPTATSAATDTCSVQNPSAFYPTFFLALFLGVFGVHRFYLAKIGTGVLQLFTFGGFGVWWLVDMITILFGKFRDKKGAVIPNVNPKVSWSVFAIFVIIGLASRGTNSSLSTSTSNSEGASIMASGMDPAVTRSAPLRPSQPLKPSVYIPEDQQDFINAIVPFIKQYQNAPNELKKSVIRAARSEAIEKVVPSCQVRNWVGTLKKLGTTSDGKAYIEIALEGTKNVTVKTWNNAFSDTTDKTLIELNSPLFIKLSDMTEGTRVSFSGIFIRGEQDYLRESSVTEHGLMTDPEFIMSFFDVSNNHE